MFHNARLKLTAWYLLIIMAISIAFSSVIFFGSTSEFNRLLRMQKVRSEHPEYSLRVIPGNRLQLLPLPEEWRPDPQVIEDAKERLLVRLGGVNLVILILSALAGYFLAGRTLRPIQEMVDDQNRFVTDASHELNTPLTSLRTTIEVNLRNKKLSLSQAKEVLKSNLEEVQNLQLLSSELMQLTQYEKAKGATAFVPLSLSSPISSAIEKVMPLASQKNITIHSEISDIYILGDERSLVEVFIILLDNAIKYSPEKTTISFAAKRTDGKVEIRVTDKGIGIPKEDIPHIFDRFYRADKSRTKTQVPGYGLGLAIASRLIENHHGTITVDSVVGEGTTFIVTLSVMKK